MAFQRANSRSGLWMRKAELRACWAKWAVAKRIARTPSFLLTDSLRFGLRTSSCGLLRYPGQLRLINSRICGVKTPARGRSEERRVGKECRRRGGRDE